MIFRFHPSVLAVLLAFCCSSCGDDPKLVEKRDKQKSEVTRLKGELALIDEKLKTMPPDVTAELNEAKRLSVKQTAEVETLQTEIAALEAKKRSLESEFESYQRKYQAK
ncbi:MAG: hypothetical protein EOP85_22355 [Verrucomicrobiaceae bacterium]|nr:MAG: hypothetical protein EOP85_22355 [Verrucomicrobiaceae bacterium]